MKKLLAPQLVVLFLCALTLPSFAQDSAKKVSHPKVQVGKTPAAYAAKPAGYYKARYYRKPGDTTHYAYHRAVADTTQKAALPDVASDKSLAGQYQYLLTKVYFYQQPLLNAYHKSIMDTLWQARGALKTSQAKVASQNKVIDSLQSAIKSNDASLNASTERVDSIDMFGIVLPKSTYNLIMWGLVLVFGVIAIIVIARSGRASGEAKYRVQLYNELEEEYKNYKLKANEKEKRLARELQTERNKLDELLGKG